MTELLHTSQDSYRNHFKEAPLGLGFQKEERDKDKPDVAVVLLWENDPGVARFKREQDEALARNPLLKAQFYDEVLQPHTTGKRIGLLEDLTPEQLEALPYELQRQLRGLDLPKEMTMGERVEVHDGILNYITAASEKNPLKRLHDSTVLALRALEISVKVGNFEGHTTGKYAKKVNKDDVPAITKIVSSTRPAKIKPVEAVLAREWPVRDDKRNIGYYAFDVISRIPLDG